MNLANALGDYTPKIDLSVWSLHKDCTSTKRTLFSCTAL